MDVALASLASPAVLAFALGIGAGAARTDLELPDALAQTLSIYLMFAIGLKGGASVAAAADGWSVVAALGAGALLSALLPLVAFALLRVIAAPDRRTAAAIAAHYGSISVVTFATAAQVLDAAGLSWEGHLVGVAAVMEAPAILTGLVLAGATSQRSGDDGGSVVREVLLHGSIWLLLGGLAIGTIVGKEGIADIKPFFVDPFAGVLCLFLLDMGLVVARRFTGGEGVRDPRLLAFGLLQPLVGATFGLLAALVLGLSVGGATLMMVLGASASYIAVPAAMRMALPDVDPSTYVALSLGVTFPFNVVVGIPVYLTVAQAVLG